MAPVLVAAVAFAVRLVSVLHSGGLGSLLGYDEGVYFGASLTFVSGLMPYRDFVLLHPPGSLLVFSPFALLGHVTSDSTAWAAARIGVMMLGALNAALVYLIARRVNVVAAIVAGGLYAVWSPAVHVERTTMLEAVVLTGTLVALWALRNPQESAWRLVLAGGFLGMGLATKLWAVVPLAVIVGWLLLSRAWRSALVVAAAASVVTAAIVLPFAFLAGGRVLDLVLLAQIGRGSGGTRRGDRPARMFNVDATSWVNARTVATLAIVAVLVVAAAMIIALWKVPRARLWVALLGAQISVLMLVPVYFDGYSSFIAAALMLVIGTAVATVLSARRRLSDWLAIIVPTAVIAVVVGVGVVSLYRSVYPPRNADPQVAAISSVTASATCVGSDSAGLLILNNVLTRNVQRGCPTVLDFDGTVYSFGAGANPKHWSANQRRRRSVEYQQAMRDYFAANDILIIHRAKADVLDTKTAALLASRTRLLHFPGLHVLGLAAQRPSGVRRPEPQVHRSYTGSSRESATFHGLTRSPALVEPGE